MGVSIELKGRLEPIDLKGDLMDVASSMNVAMAGGKTLFMCEDIDGNPRVINMAQILSMGEAEEDNAFLA